MTLETLLDLLANNPSQVHFQDVITLIDSLYTFTPSEFTNGQGENTVINAKGSNEGSCKIFAFGLEQNLSEQHILHCFGNYYREDVLKHPTGNDHANIRTFMQHGWDGIHFSSPALHAKQ